MAAASQEDADAPKAEEAPKKKFNPWNQVCALAHARVGRRQREVMVIVCAAGESKLKKATEKKTRIIDEDGLFAIIKASGPPSAAASAGGANGGAAAANKPEPTLKKVAPSPSKKVAPSPSSSAPGPSAHQHVKVCFHRPTLTRAAHGIGRGRSQGGGRGHARPQGGKGPWSYVHALARAVQLEATPDACAHAHTHARTSRPQHSGKASASDSEFNAIRTEQRDAHDANLAPSLWVDKVSTPERETACARWQSLGVAGGCALVCVGIFWRLHA